jgi:dihydrofolate reductase
VSSAVARTPALVLVVAVAENGVIGRRGALPWRLKSDMAHFKAVTMGTPMIMGRKTWDSLPKKPLPGRTNIVMTRDASFTAPGALVAASVERALDAARGDALRRGAGSISVIGGAEIFNATLPVADRIAFTRVHLAPAGDTFFPPLAAAEWREAGKHDHPAGPGDEAAFTILTYERERPGN